MADHDRGAHGTQAIGESFAATLDGATYLRLEEKGRGRALKPGHIFKFAAVGIASTIAYAMLYLMLQDAFGAQSANLSALLMTAMLNTAANRRLTFGTRGQEHYVVATVTRFALLKHGGFRDRRASRGRPQRTLLATFALDAA